eukprot:gene19932-26638_t
MVDTVFNSWVMDRCTTITEPYHPMPFLANGHVETIYAAFYRKAPTILYDRECLLMTDGGCIVLDSERDKDALPHDAPVLILLPGLTGGSHDSYVCYAVQTAREQYYSASYTGDMRAVVEYVSERYPKSTLLAGGWSLGANILIRYLAEEGESCKIAAAVSMCNPFNLVISNAAMETGFNKVYDSSLASNLVGMMEKHADIWKDAEGHVLVDKAKLAKNIRQFDDAITIRCFGWESVDEYYVGSSSSLSIPQVTMPLLCIQALDDPIAPKVNVYPPSHYAPSFASKRWTIPLPQGKCLSPKSLCPSFASKLWTIPLLPRSSSRGKVEGVQSQARRLRGK